MKLGDTVLVNNIWHNQKGTIEFDLSYQILLTNTVSPHFTFNFNLKKSISTRTLSLNISSLV